MFEFKKIDTSSQKVKHYTYGPFILIISKMGNIWYGVLKYRKNIIIKLHPESFQAVDANVKRYLKRNMLEKSKEVIEGLFRV